MDGKEENEKLPIDEWRPLTYKGNDKENTNVFHLLPDSIQ